MLFWEGPYFLLDLPYYIHTLTGAYFSINGFVVLIFINNALLYVCKCVCLNIFQHNDLYYLSKQWRDSTK